MLSSGIGRRRVFLVRTDVSQKHIASIFRVVCSEYVPHDGRGREPLALVYPLSCLSVTPDTFFLAQEQFLHSRLFYRLVSGQKRSVVEVTLRMLSVDVWPSVTAAVLTASAPAPTTALATRVIRWTEAATVCFSAPVGA
jgi:hypothetical protein